MVNALCEEEKNKWIICWFHLPRYPINHEGIGQELKEIRKYLRSIIGEQSANLPVTYRKIRILPDGNRIEIWIPVTHSYVAKENLKPKPSPESFKDCLVGASEDGQQEPLVDIALTEYNVKVFAELRGIEKKDISIYGTEDTLTLSVDNSEMHYRKRIELPKKVSVNKAYSTFKNGVLEVTLPLYKEEQTDGEPIKID